MLADLGCVNVADGSSLLEELSLEQIILRDPDYIFAVVQGSDPTDAQAVLDAALLSNPAWDQLRAVREGHTIGYFPFFIDIADREGLIVDGGQVALRKIEKLLPYGPRLTVAAPTIASEIKAMPGLALIRAPFEEGMLEGRFFVIAATADHDLNRAVAQQCRQRGILVNAMDDRHACTFLFPALVRQGDLSIGISTGGVSPSAAVYLKEQIADMLPENFGELLHYLDSVRDEVKAALPDERRRAAFFSQLFITCVQTGWPLERMELREALWYYASCQEAAG